MRGSIPQGDPDALMTKERNSRSTQSRRLAISFRLDPAGAPQSPDRSLRARRKFPPLRASSQKLFDFRIKRPNTEMQSETTKRWLLLISFDLAVHTSCTRGALTN